MFINNFDPVAIQIFSIEIRWYSLAYIAGILLGWILIKKIFIEEDELKNNQVIWKDLSEGGGQELLTSKEVIEKYTNL